jgi:sulfate-transporting ATPase
VSDIFRFSLLGLGSGGLYALAAIGLVLVYRGSGVVNFAQAALGLAGGYVYYDVRVGWHAPSLVALLIAVAASAALGAAFHLLVMRRMRQASTLAKIVATLALLVVLQGIADLHYGVLPKLVPSMLPIGPVYIFGTAVGADRICIFGIVIVLTTLLWAIYRFTTFGVATSAVAENPSAAAALTVSPDLVAAVNWAVGGALAGIAVVFLVPITGLGSDNITLLVIPVLAAAVVGRFSSFPITTITGLVIGIGQSLVTYYVETPGWGTALPFLMVTVVLLVRGAGVTSRGERSGRLPALGSGQIRPRVVLLAVAGTLLCTWWLLGPSWRIAVQLQVIYAIILLSFVVVTGYAGQVSLAQMAFAGIGGMGAGWCMIHLHWTFDLALVGGMLATVPIGLLVGRLGARTRGVNLAIITLGFAISVEAIVYGNGTFLRPFFGISSQHLTVLGVDVSPAAHPAGYTTVAVLVLVAAGLAVANVRRGRVGRRLIAVRTNERAAAALGISVRGAKTYALCLGGAIAGLGGVLLTFQQTVPSFEFPSTDSITTLQNAVIGGVGTVAGAPVGATLQPGTLSQHLLSFTGSDVATVTSVVAGIGVLLMLSVAPDGLTVAVRDRTQEWRDRRRVRPSPLPLSPGRRRSDPGHVFIPKALEVRNLTVRFGGVVALDGLSMDVKPSEVVGLIGPNGAGKSTAIEAVTGFVSPAAGSILVGGVPVRPSDPSRRARGGVARSFQSLELFDDLTVVENFLAACDRRDWHAYLTDLAWPGHGELTDAAAGAIDDFGLSHLLSAKVADLTFAERRILAVARAAACGQPVLLLDEPAAGLDGNQTQRLGDSIRRLAVERETAVLLVEHNVDMVMRTCDRIYVLDFGQLIAHGTPDEIRSDRRVVKAYLGASLENSSGGVRRRLRR